MIEGILSFNERFSPYLIALERVLRNNEQYDDLVRKTFNNAVISLN